MQNPMIGLKQQNEAGPAETCSFRNSGHSENLMNKGAGTKTEMARSQANLLLPSEFQPE